MTFAVPRAYKINPVLAKAMDRIFILHADHEQNASTSTTCDSPARRAPGPLRLHRGRHRLPLGARPWWRQRGRC